MYCLGAVGVFSKTPMISTNYTCLINLYLSSCLDPSVNLYLLAVSGKLLGALAKLFFPSQCWGGATAHQASVIN